MSNHTDLIIGAQNLILNDAYSYHKDHVRYLSANDNEANIKVYRVSLFNEDFGLYTPDAYTEWFKGLRSDEIQNLIRDTEYVHSLVGVTTIDTLNKEVNQL